MNDKLTIPKSIKVGFQKRSDTYTGKLAYVVFIDNKGKLRKEPSWNGWRDKKIDPQDFQNVPTTGFVLNKDVGGARRRYSWNARVEKVRVYDPRDFEFEISIPNLLFILQECSAIKGKGLEGEFVYSWDGPELILLPVDSQEYKSSVDFNNLQNDKVTKNDIVEGCSYLTKNKENVIYMGSHVWWGEHSIYRYGREKNGIGKKKHVFAIIDNEICKDYVKNYEFIIDDGFTKLAKRTSTSPVPQYAEIYDKFMKSGLVGKPTKLITAPCKLGSGITWRTHVCLEANGKFYTGVIYPSRHWYYDHGYGYRNNYQNPASDFVIECDSSITIKDGKYITTGDPYKIGVSNIEEARKICKSVWVECDNGYKQEIISCTI